MTRVLLTGARGQLGSELAPLVREPLTPTLDLRDRHDVVGAITALRPDVVVHAGAWTDVDGCEADPDRAYATNALGTRHVAEGARRVGAHVVYVSTDYVFDGTKHGAYDEWDDPNPQSVYGRSKRGGELELDPGSTIVRTSWVFGRHGRNFVKSVLRREGPLRVVDDQRGCPTAAEDLARVVRDLALSRLPGVFHVTNQGATTWFQLARDVRSLAGHDPGSVEAISSAQLGRAAPRPANSVLGDRALRLTGIPLPVHHHEPLERLVKELTA